MFPLNESLAELVGVIIGDGCLYRKQYMVMITGHIKNDRLYYELLVKYLKGLGLNPRLNIRGRGLRLVIRNKLFYNFLAGLGVHEGKKAFVCTIPDTIVADKSLLRSCIRGIFNSDGTIFVSEKPGVKRYPTIELATSSKELKNQLDLHLKNFGLRPRTRKIKDSRTGNTIHRIALHGKLMVKLWYDVIGMTHPYKTETMSKILSEPGGNRTPIARFLTQQASVSQDSNPRVLSH